MDTANLIKSFDALLSDFENVSPVKPTIPPTYLEITGKAHKEDVISNVLAFFLDANQFHGLGTHFYETFMRCMGITDDFSDERIETVSREVTTAKGLRIDLVIETSKRILAIENKVYHWLHNDLREYAAHIRRLDRVKSCHLAVLSVYPQRVDSAIGANVTYEAFIRALETGMKLKAIKPTDRFAPFLTDFFTTVRTLREQNMLDEDLRRYLIDNKGTISRLQKEIGRFDDEINSRAHRLLKLVKKPNDVESLVWRRFAVINQRFFDDGLWLKADCIIDYNGYVIHVFAQRVGSGETTKKTLEAIPYFNEKTGWNVFLENERMPFDAPLQEVADKMNEVIGVVFPPKL